MILEGDARGAPSPFFVNADSNRDKVVCFHIVLKVLIPKGIGDASRRRKDEYGEGRDEWLVASERRADEGVGRSGMVREQRPLSIADGA